MVHFFLKRLLKNIFVFRRWGALDIWAHIFTLKQKWLKWIKLCKMPPRSFKELAFDSLMSIDISNWISLLRQISQRDIELWHPLSLSVTWYKWPHKKLLSVWESNESMWNLASYFLWVNPITQLGFLNLLIPWSLKLALPTLKPLQINHNSCGKKFVVL